MTTDTAAMEELRRDVQPIVETIYPPTMRQIVEDCGADLLRDHFADVERAAMLVVARARAEALRARPCYRAWLTEKNIPGVEAHPECLSIGIREGYRCERCEPLAAAEALVAELAEKGEQR